MVNLPTCACGCGVVLKRRGKSGPPPMYATPSCRMRAMRRRRVTSELVPLADQVRPAPIHVTSGTVDGQIARALLEARLVGFAFQRLGTQARPDLAWRCTRLGDAIIDALGDNFGEVGNS